MDYDYDYDYEGLPIPPYIGKKPVPPGTLTIFIGVLAKRTVSGSMSGSVPEEGTSVSAGEFFTKGNEGNQGNKGGCRGSQSKDLGPGVARKVR